MTVGNGADETVPKPEQFGTRRSPLADYRAPQVKMLPVMAHNRLVSRPKDSEPLVLLDGLRYM